MSISAQVAAGVLSLAVLVLAVDRAVAAGWFDRRTPRASTPHRSVGSGFLGELIELFQPSHQNITDEQDRQALDIRQTPAEGPIDLESGVVRLDVRARQRDDEPRPDQPSQA